MSKTVNLYIHYSHANSAAKHVADSREASAQPCACVHVRPTQERGRAVERVHPREGAIHDESCNEANDPTTQVHDE
jgi:hypothetical protein